jgi:hypothetical protein
VRASEVPDTMNTVSTLQVLQTIVIAWTNPSDDGGEEIDAFEVQLLKPDNSFADDPLCTGSLANGNLCVFPN